MVDKGKLELVKARIGYENILRVDRLGRGRGFVVFWLGTSEISMLSCSPNYVDMKVVQPTKSEWALTGYYDNRTCRKDGKPYRSSIS